MSRRLKTVLGLLGLAACLTPARGVLITETFSFNNLNQLVPNGSATGLANQQSLSSSIQSISTMSVNLQVSGGFNGDLYAYVSHGSVASVLLDRTGRTASNSAGYADAGFDVTFNDTAANGDIHSYRNTTIPGFGSPLTGTWQPDARTANPYSATDTSPRTGYLGVFNGAAGAGNWTLFIADVNSSSGASSNSTLTGWGLTLTGQGYGSLAFDANTAAAGAQDGSGVWDATTANWHDGTKNVVWSNTFYDTAVFGSGSGAAGMVTVGTVNANAITFNAAASGGYTLTGGTITLGAYSGGPTPTITANANATIASTIAGTAGLIKAGAATLTLAGTNTYTGETVVTQGKLAAAADGAISGTARITVNAGGTLLLGNSAASNRINDAAPLTLAGGTLARDPGVSEGGSGTTGLGALTLSANSSIDFGTVAAGSLGTLTFASFAPAGLTLDILDYLSHGQVAGGGADDRLIFHEDEFANLGSFSFDGVAATEISLGNGYYEIVPVPEPGEIVGMILLTLVSVRRLVFPGFRCHLMLRGSKQPVRGGC